MGANTINTGIPSTKSPSTNRNKITIHRATVPLEVRACITFTTVSGKLSHARNQLNMDAMAIIKRDTAVVAAPFTSILGISFNLMVLYTNIPIINAYTTATTPASVAVKIPDRIPPIIMIGISIGMTACFAALPIFLRENVPAVPYPRLRLIKYTATLMAKAIRIPGTIPAISILVIFTLAITAYITSMTLGGIMGPIVEDATVTATLNSFE